MSTQSLPTNRTIDWVVVFLLLGLLATGWLMLYAAVYDSTTTVEIFSLKSTIGIQSLWLIIALLGFWLCLYIDWKFWNTFAFVFYAIALVLLLGVLIFGVEIKGARSWYRIASFSFQPSEFAKLATCLALASFLGNYKTDLRNIRTQLIAFGIMLAPALLILLQPDAGSALTFFSFMILLYREGLSNAYYQIGGSLILVFILTIMFGPYVCIATLIGFAFCFYLLQMNKKWFWYIGLGVILISLIYLWQIIPPLYIVIGLFLTFIGFSVYLWFNRFQSLVGVFLPAILFLSMISIGTNYFFEKVLKPHQQDRINVWLKPHECDPQGSLYNINQSKTAIGSGGIIGKGFLGGIMTEGNHVPEQTTDFIFSTLGEEQGFIGVFSVILLFFLLMYRIIVIGERAKNLFVRRYAYGIAGIIFLHFFVNIGMTMGLAPVIGIPLPFISKGGTSLFFFALMLGILVKMDMSRNPN